jgi:pimeloyl-[acyl-carrier protein] methyl ester esterase
LHERPFAWAGLVAINGFPRFTEGPDYMPAAPRRLVDRMVTRFGTVPATVLDDFRRRCGSAEPAPPADPGRLGVDLLALRDWDARAGLSGPLLALAGEADPIVPPAMTDHAFADFPLEMRPGAGHLLPLAEPDWCAGRIAAFVAGLGI